MTDVIAWPPVGLTGWSIHDNFPRSQSRGLISGLTRTSAIERPRRLATAVVAGRGPNQSGAGYIRMLNRRWGSAPRLTRVECFPENWHLNNIDVSLRNSFLDWTDGSTELLWTHGATDLWWSDNLAMSGSPTTVGGKPALSVTGLPPNRIVARPADLISVSTPAATERVFAMAVARSDASGAATILLEEAVTLSGLVSVGERESVVFEAQGVPRSVQSAQTGDWAFTWEFREVFEEEYDTPWVEVDPWR
jgi:hypothetical protein